MLEETAFHKVIRADGCDYIIEREEIPRICPLEGGFDLEDAEVCPGDEEGQQLRSARSGRGDERLQDSELVEVAFGGEERDDFRGG